MLLSKHIIFNIPMFSNCFVATIKVYLLSGEERNLPFFCYTVYIFRPGDLLKSWNCYKHSAFQLCILKIASIEGKCL